MTNASPDRPRVALLGTGTMGRGMARNIAAAGLSVRVWNRSRDKVEPLAAVGAVVTDTPADAVSDADVIITMLFDADSAEEVISQAVGHFADDAIWAQMSTVGITGTDRLAGLAERLALTFVDAPVLGTKKPAEDGALVVLASGPESARVVCTPVFDAVGSRTLWVGAAGSGTRLKLAANAWVLTVLEGIAESVTLAEKLGLDPRLFFQAIEGGAMDAPYVGLKGAAMLARDFDPSFTVSGAAKDAELILEAAKLAGVELPTTGAALKYLQRAIEGGHGDEDMAATYLAH